MSIDQTDDSDSGSEDEGSITLVISEMKQGEMSNADLLVKRFTDRLERFVRERMNRRVRTLGNSDDVVVNTLNDLFQGLWQGRYSELSNRESFWRLLVVVACRNVCDEVNHEKRQKRGGGKVVHASSLEQEDSTSLFERVAADSKSPYRNAMIREECESLLKGLENEELQVIVLMKMAKYTNEQISRTLDIKLRSVERSLAKIRQLWSAKIK